MTYPAHSSSKFLMSVVKSSSILRTRVCYTCILYKAACSLEACVDLVCMYRVVNVDRATIRMLTWLFRQTLSYTNTARNIKSYFCTIFNINIDNMRSTTSGRFCTLLGISSSNLFFQKEVYTCMGGRCRWLSIWCSVKTRHITHGKPILLHFTIQLKSYQVGGVTFNWLALFPTFEFLMRSKPAFG